MKVFRLMFQRETVAPMLALSFASAVSVAMVIARMAWMRDSHYAFLIWNLFLAWMPMVFALLAREHQQENAIPAGAFSLLASPGFCSFQTRPISSPTLSI